MDTCFNCGRIIKTDKCPYCGYVYSFEDKCPRKRGVTCVNTNKLCSVRDYHTCKVLRSND